MPQRLLYANHNSVNSVQVFSIHYYYRMAKPNPLIRPLVHDLHAYVPGEQPKIKGLIKLNTNENPYPPSAKVLAAVKAAVDGRWGLYPNPTPEKLRKKR